MRRVDAAIYRSALEDHNAHAVMGTRCRRNGYLHTLELSRPLHFGDYGGLPLKIIWGLFDVVLIVVLVSGLYLWLSKRKSPLERELDYLVERQSIGQVGA